VCLSEKTREASRWVWMFVESRRALVTPTCTVLDKEARSNSVGFDPLGLTQLGSSHTPAPSEQTHPQNSRFTPRCPTVVLWTPCSGVEWRVFEPTIRVWRSGKTGKQPANLAVEAAEESQSILPDYTATVRPAQALLTILT
jgi:hypothetical protein